MLYSWQPKITCWSLCWIPLSVSRVLSAMVWTFYVATLRAWSMLAAFREGSGSEALLRNDHASALRDDSLTLDLLWFSSRIPVLCVELPFFIHRSLFAIILVYEPSCSVLGPLALIHLSGERTSEVRICLPQINRLWLYVVRCVETRTWLDTTSFMNQRSGHLFG